MNPLQQLDLKISHKTTIMWIFRALSIVPTLIFLAGLNGSAILALVGFVLMAPLDAVHFTMWFQIRKLKQQRQFMLRPPMPTPRMYPQAPWGPPQQRPQMAAQQYPPQPYHPNYRPQQY